MVIALLLSLRLRPACILQLSNVTCVCDPLFGNAQTRLIFFRSPYYKGRSLRSVQAEFVVGSVRAIDQELSHLCFVSAAALEMPSTFLWFSFHVLAIVIRVQVLVMSPCRSISSIYR